MTSRSSIANNLYAMRQALEHAGVRFVFEGKEATGIAIANARGQSDQLSAEDCASDR